MQRTPSSLAALVLAPVLLASACSSGAHMAGALQEPGGLKQMSTRPLKGPMRVLATNVLALDTLMAASPSAEGIAEAQKLLQEMHEATEGTAAALGHPFLGPRLSTLRDSIAAAQAGLAEAPPNTYAAGQLSGTCLQCHGRSGDPRR